MATIPPLVEGQIEALARLLGECGSGTDISRVLHDRGLVDNSGESTKWRRLYWVFLDCQNRHGCANHVIDFIRAFLTPARFVGRSQDFEAHRRELNAILAFSGLEYGADGHFRKVDAAATLDEAERRVRTIRSKFQGRRMHPEVVKYCSAELMQDNYFHAVFEAAKGLAQRIRDMTGVQADGAHLIDRVFSIDRPLLALNTLQTETEKSEHKGFSALLKGCFAAVRNPLAHEPRILWDGEDDAADYLSLISLLHRKLDRRIRRYIRAKQKLIKLLEEQKQAIIHRAVTRGLDPNVRLKPSGVEWLGDVPAHWDVVPLKRIGTVRIGLTYLPSDVSGESGTLVLRASNVSKGKVVHADNVRVSRNIPATLRVREGDILVCVRSGSRSLVGKSALITKEFEGASYGAFMSLLRTIDNRFYFRVLHSNLLPTVMAQFETSTINQLTQNDLRSLMVPFPPDIERAAITDFLDGETTTADGAIAAATAEIDLLREYRTRLIADVVTGKLDVREAAARLPQETEDLETLDEAEVEGDAEQTDAGDGDGVPEEAEA